MPMEEDRNKPSRLTRWVSDLGALLLPRFCPVCSGRLVPSEPFICMSCSMQWPRLHLPSITDNVMLRRMWPHVPVEQACSVIVYRHQSPFHQILISIKYRGAVSLAREMGSWAALETAPTGLFQQVDVMVPVPLSPAKKRKRGYNQARLLAEGMSRQNGLPIRDWLTRKNEATTQTHLSEEERIANTAHDFMGHIPVGERGQRILLVDDVFTTGATLTACALALLQSDPTATINVFTLSYAG